LRFEGTEKVRFVDPGKSLRIPALQFERHADIKVSLEGALEFFDRMLSAKRSADREPIGAAL